MLTSRLTWDQEGKMLPKIIITIVLISAGYFGYNQYFAKTYINEDTIIQGDYNPNPNKTLVFKNNATLTVEGNATVKNPIECQNGSININVKGNLSVSNKLDCQNEDKTSAKGVEGVGIALAVGGNVEFTDSASVSSSGHILLVDNPDHFPKTQEDLEKLFIETGMDTNDGNFRIGPLGTDEENKHSPINIDQIIKNSNITVPAKKSVFNLISPVLAADPGDVVLRGKWKINTPPPGVKQILIFLNFPGRSLEINGEMTGPDGRDADDIKGDCYINIPGLEDDELDKKSGDKKYTDNDAFRMRARSGRLVIGNFKLTLGNGGNGGNAETDECESAFALAGTGGQSGTMKFTAVNEIIIKDSFTIIPGKGGQGGDAIARGKKGESGNPGKQGGYTLAIGGYGANNIRNLKSLGKVLGLEKIFIGSVIGGDGGDATSIPGDGGDGSICDAKGGLSGLGEAYGGPGGTMGLTLPPGVKDTNDADDHNGAKGKEIVNQANPGKDGPPCDGDGGQTETFKKVDSTPTPSPTSSLKKSSSNTQTIGYFSGIVGTTEVTLLPHPGITVSDYTPLKVEVKASGKLIWQTTINKSDCKETPGFPGCNVPGYKYNSDWDGLSLEMKAYDQDGILRASSYTKSSTPWRPSCTGSDCPPPFIQAPLP